jgi:hypothetical protein
MAGRLTISVSLRTHTPHNPTAASAQGGNPRALILNFQVILKSPTELEQLDPIPGSIYQQSAIQRPTQQQIGSSIGCRDV